jgi:shikimate kinase
LFARGESRFRDRERAALQSLLLEPAFGRQSVVVATGGGVVMDPANREDMARAGTIIFLDVPLDELVGRLRAQGEAERRPLVASAGIAMRRRLAVLMAARRQCYLDRSIVIDGRGSVQAVLSRLRAELGIEACRDSEAV